MTSHEFTFWLRGFIRAVDDNNITSSQWREIQSTLNSVESGNEWKPEHGTNSPKHKNNFNPPYTTGGADDFMPQKELLLSNK
jgi:hypothetical protein